MDNTTKLAQLQTAYAAAMVDSVAQYQLEGVLEKVTERKRSARHVTSTVMNRNLGVTAPHEVFTKLSDLFNCAPWGIEPRQGGFTAQTRTCTMFTIAKRMNAPAPCRLYCLDPMESMIKALNPAANFETQQTLFAGDCCRVEVTEHC